MTRDAFIESVIIEVTEGRSIPVSPKKPRLNSIIDTAIKYFKENDDESVEFEYIIIPNSVVSTPLFKAKRQIQLPKCVEAITGLEEMNSLLGSRNINPDYRKTNLNYHLALSGDSDQMLYGVVASYYADFMRNFVIKDVTFEYNSHTHMLTVVGRDHFYDLIAKSYVHIGEEAMFESIRFFDYVVGKTKISFTNVFGFVDAKLIGGLSLDISGMKTDGKDAVKEVKQLLIDDRQTVDFWDEF